MYVVLHVAVDAEGTSRGGRNGGVWGAKHGAASVVKTMFVVAFGGRTPIKSLNIRLNRAT